jgi:hypothetical protein
MATTNLLIIISSHTYRIDVFAPIDWLLSDDLNIGFLARKEARLADFPNSHLGNKIWCLTIEW